MHSLVNNNFDNIKIHDTNVKRKIAALLYLTICLIYMTVRTSNSENSCTHEASDIQFN